MVRNIPLVNDTLSKEVRFENERRGMIYFLMSKHAEKFGLNKEAYARSAVNRIGRDNRRLFAKHYDYFPDFVFSFMNEGLIGQFRPELMKMTDDEALVEFHYCPMLGGLCRMTENDGELRLLCDCAMETDRGLTAEVGVDFELGDTIANGCDTCQLYFKRRKGENG